MQDKHVEFLHSDNEKYIPINLITTNYGFGGANPDIEPLVNTSIGRDSVMTIDFPDGVSAIVMLMDPTTGKIHQIENLLPNETRMRFTYRGSNWIYVVTKEYDDGFISQQGIVDPNTDETNRLTTREDLVNIRLDDNGALVKSVSDDPDANQWYNFTGTYTGPLIWDMPEGALSVNLGDIAKELDELAEAQAYLIGLYSLVNSEFNKFGGNIPTFVNTEDRSKDKTVVVHKIIDKFIQSTFSLNKDDQFWDDLNINYDNSYVKQIWERFQSEYLAMGMFNAANGSSYIKGYVDHFDTYGFLIDRLDTGGQGNIDGYSSKRSRFMYAEAQVSFSDNPFIWTETDASRWIPSQMLQPQTEYGQKNFNAIKYEVQNPLIEARRLSTGGEGHNPILISIFSQGGQSILNLIDGTDVNNPGIIGSAASVLENIGVGDVLGSNLESVNSWWNTNINKATNWFNNVYGTESSKGWVFTELERIEGLIADRRIQFALSFNDIQNEGGDQQLGFNAIMQNITFIKNLMGYLDDNLWATLITTNTDILTRIIGVEEKISANVSTNTMINITGAKVGASDIEVLYRRINDSTWTRLNSIIELSEEIKMLNLNNTYFETIGKYVVLVRPKHIEVDINSISENNIVSVYNQLNDNQAKNYYYGWNIQFRDPLGNIKGTEKVITGSYWNINGQHMQISPIIDGEVLAIESNIKATMWNNSFIPIMITIDIVEQNNLTLSYYMYGKKELNNNTGECIIYDHNGNVYKKQSFGTYSTDASGRDIVDYRLPLE